MLALADAREPSRHFSNRTRISTKKDLNFVSCSPFSDNVLATGGDDSVISLFDARSLARPTHVLKGHKGQVTQASWSPLRSSLIASCASDRWVWFSRVGAEDDDYD